MKTQTATYKGNFSKILLNKSFSEMSHDLKTVLLSTLFDVASKNDYLENNTSHTDAIGYHLSKLEISAFKQMLCEFFDKNLQILKKSSTFYKVTLAFDETFIPYYGKKTKFWINAYNNKVKGAKGSYKFMCCSVIINNQRLILYALPMKRGDYTEKIVKQILEKIKKYLKISEVLFDRGFASKKIVQTLTLLNVKYVILCPKRTNVKRFLQKNLWRVTEVKKINSNFSTYSVEMKYVIAYDFKDHDWIMLTNINRKPYSLVRLYKKRWGIETAFRVMDHADIKSKSTNIVIRTFFFIVSIVLYNMWVFKEDRWQCTFKTFVYEMNIVLKDTSKHIKEILEVKKKYLKKLDYLEEEMLALVS